MEPLILRHVAKAFGPNQVLKDVSLTVPAHTLFGLAGLNGAGKTTAMKLILGLLPLDSGEIRVCGERPRQGRGGGNIGYLPDVPAFYPTLTALEYLTLCGEISGLSPREVKPRARALLSRVGLGGVKGRIKGFSREMKQRLGIAQALMGNPRLLICDEPTSALDPAGRRDILELLQAAKAETTVVLSTHILSDVERVCDEVAFLHGGGIVLQGSLEEVKRLRPAEGFEVEAYDPQAAQKLLAAFPDGVPKEPCRLVFSQGTQARMAQVLAHIAAQALPVKRIEMLEPTLEALFMEVAAP